MMLRLRFEISQEQKVLIVVSVLAFGAFLVHSYTIINRYLQHEMLQIYNVIYNHSLPMPIVDLRFDSWRHPNSSRPFVDINYVAFFNEKPAPKWSYLNDSIRTKTWHQDSITMNAVNASNYDEGKSKWPLRLDCGTGARDLGYLIEAYINATNYVEMENNGDKDSITARIYNFGTDPAENTYTKGVPEYFELFPCDELTVSIRLRHKILINRPESPCRNEYPLQLKKLLKFPMEPTDLFNSVLAPNLPYDQDICEHLCVVNYWLPKCNCVICYDVWTYAGKRIEMPLCPQEIIQGSICTFDGIMARTPAKVFDTCECSKPCTGYSFDVNGYDKVHYNFGNEHCSKRENSMVRLRVFYAALSYESIVETEAYPLEEMVNELVGIIGLYFGYSVTSVAPLCYLVVQKLYLSNSQSNSINLETKNKWKPLQLQSETDEMNEKFSNLTNIVEGIAEKMNSLQREIHSKTE